MDCSDLQRLLTQMYRSPSKNDILDSDRYNCANSVCKPIQCTLSTVAC